MERLYITNAQLVLPDQIIPRGTVVVQGGRIAAIAKGKLASRCARGINARGYFLSPGFIDLHIHGDIAAISRREIAGGTTSFLATLHPGAPKALLNNIRQTQAALAELKGARCLGIRLEGPFLNRDFCGALPRKLLRAPDIEEAQRIIQAARGSLKILILAPELKGTLRLIRLLNRHNIVSSIGHTGATYAQTETAIGAGATHATHTFNRMRAFDHCDPGALGAVLTDERVSCEVIADGIHVHPVALRLLLACKGLNQVMLVTDSTAAQKYPAKKRAGLVFRLKKGTLYGTALKLNQALKNAVKFLDITLPEAVRLVTLNPAKVLKIDRRKGSLAVGKDADLVIFDKNFNVQLTLVEGKVVYVRNSRVYWRKAGPAHTLKWT
ncbi:MAG: N-acetylglucosamine-6-phosphate deacetylase [Candidatus Omnitrophica bacterium]|nr:N-acetylglucosamine-6-phosphate deacetylase [Candidatus Omnitrophota bacterium]